MLDEHGGTDVVATLPQYVTFTEGVQVLTCLSLTENGLLRWYASCCNTPIGNTPRNHKVSFVGLVHTCLEGSASSVESSFGPVRMRAHTSNAKGKPKPMRLSTFTSVMRFMAGVVRARVDGTYKCTPFFDSNRGDPIAVPKVLSTSELARVMNAV